MDGRQNLQANIMHDVVERCRFASKNVTGGSLGALYYPRNSVANGWQMPCRDMNERFWAQQMHSSPRWIYAFLWLLCNRCASASLL